MFNLRLSLIRYFKIKGIIVRVATIDNKEYIATLLYAMYTTDHKQYRYSGSALVEIASHLIGITGTSYLTLHNKGK